MKKPRKNKWKILKYFILGFFILIQFVALSGAYFFNTHSGGKQTAAFLANMIGSKIQSKVEISSVDLGTKAVILHQLAIYDTLDNPVLTAEEVDIDINRIRKKIKKLKFGKIRVVEANFHGRMYEGDSLFNFQVLINHLSKSDPNKTKATKVRIKEIELVDSRFRLQRPNTDKYSGLINFDDLIVDHIDGKFSDVTSEGQKLDGYVSELNGIQSDGFRINNSSCWFRLNEKYLRFDKAHIETNGSRLNGDIAFLFDNIADFSDYERKINMNFYVESATLAVDELKYFSKPLPSDETRIMVSGHFTGPLIDMSSSDFKLFFGNESQYQGSIRIKGLPDIEESYINLKLSKAYFSFVDLHTLIPAIAFPEYFYSLGASKFKGSFTGFYNDFVAFGNLNTKYGQVASDINFKIPENGIAKYAGKIELNNFDLGQFTGSEDLGMTSFSGEIDGEGLNIEQLESSFKGKLSTFELRKYVYHNIKIDAQAIRKKFIGKLVLIDPNGNLTFDGTVDLNDKIPKFDATAVISKTNFKKLGLVKDSLLVDAMLNLDMSGSNLDNLKGKLMMLNGNLKTADENYKINTLLLESRIKNEQRTINLRSELADATLKGHFSPKKLPDLFLQSIAVYIDSSLVPLKYEKVNDQSIDFNVHLKKTNFLNSIIGSKLVFEDNSTFRGYIDQKSKLFRLRSSVPSLMFGAYQVFNLQLNGTNRGPNLNVYASFDKFSKNDTLVVDNLTLSSVSSIDSSIFDIYFHLGAYDDHARLKGKLNLTNDTAIVKFSQSEITTSNNEKWQLNSDAITIGFQPVINIPSLALINGSKSIRMFGNISKNPDLPFRILVNNVDFPAIEKYIPAELDKFSGILNGQIVAYSLLEAPYFDAALVANPLSYETTDSIGILSLSSNYTPNSAHTNLSATFYNNDMDLLAQMDGYVDISRDKDIDLKIRVPDAKASDLQPFLVSLASSLEGQVQAELNIKGPLNDIKIFGGANIQNAAFVLDYLKTRYHFSHEVKIDEKGIYINDLVLSDDFGNTGNFNGIVHHNNFSNFYFDLNLLADKLIGLNTGFDDNSVYYGRAFASGKVSITGPLELIRFDIQIKAENKSKIYLKAYDDNDFGNYNFIHFINRYTPGVAMGRRNAGGIEGLELNLDMELNPNTDIELLLDPNTNDVIKGNGRGNLSLKIDAFNNINMYGTYYIDNGSYTLRVMDLINREFKIREGSSISWKGDPFDALMDIEAYYQTQASLYDLIPEPKYQQQNVPVEARIKLNGSLFSPTPALDFSILSSSSLSGGMANALEVQQQIRMIKEDQQELNKQVISLLIMNSFLPVSTGVAGASLFDNSLNTNVSSLASAQVSNWLSQLSNEFGSKYLEDIKVGVNYQAQNDKYQRELDLLFSSSLFNDRVKFSGSYDVENINANFQVDYQIKDDSKTRLKVFSRSNNNPIYQQNTTRQGVGFYYRESFDKWKELFIREKE